MERLPRGRHGLPREFVAQNQRERLIAALAGCLDGKGLRRHHGLGRSANAPGVSKSDFYKHFESKDACFVAAYDDAVERIRARRPRRLRSEEELGDGGCSPRSPRLLDACLAARAGAGSAACWSRACAPAAASTTATAAP